MYTAKEGRARPDRRLRHRGRRPSPTRRSALTMHHQIARRPARGSLRAAPATCDGPAHRRDRQIRGAAADDRARTARDPRPPAFLYVAERFDQIHAIDRWVIEHGIALLDRHPPRPGARDQPLRPLARRPTARRAHQRQCSRRAGADPRPTDLRDHRNRRDRKHPPRPRVRRRTHHPRLPIRARRLRRRLRLVLLPQIPLRSTTSRSTANSSATAPPTAPTSSSSKRSCSSPTDSAKKPSPNSSRTPTSCRLVRALGVDHAQGYEIARPQPLTHILTPNPTPQPAFTQPKRAVHAFN